MLLTAILAVALASPQTEHRELWAVGAPAPPLPPWLPGACENSCNFADDGVCDDGGPLASYDVCELGTDCNDCGYRNMDVRGETLRDIVDWFMDKLYLAILTPTTAGVEWLLSLKTS